MNNKNKSNVKILLNILNIIIYELLMFIIVKNNFPNDYFGYINGYVVLGLLYTILLILFSKLFNSFNIGDTTTTDLFISHSLSLLFSNLIIYVLECLVAYQLVNFVPIILLQVIGMITSGIVLSVEEIIMRSKFPPLRVICIYGEKHDDLIGKLNNPNELSIRIVKSVYIKDLKGKELEKLLDENIDGLITLDINHNDKKKIFKLCYIKKLFVYDMPSITDVLISSGNILHMVDTPIIKVNKFGPNQFESIIKRLIDIIGSLLLIIVTSPIMLITAIAIKINDGGDVLYRQQRLTKDGKEFYIVKFRSMIMNAEDKTGVVLAKENDERITKVGKVIRKFRIDELPQMFNILSGNMSFVGPRPERKEIYKEIIKKMPEFEYRLCVKAGLTGYAQIYGKYNTSLRDKLLLDIYYIEKYSVIEDIKLMILTLKVIFKSDSTEGIKDE